VSTNPLVTSGVLLVFLFCSIQFIKIYLTIIFIKAEEELVISFETHLLFSLF
jgi:hypothetical protein